MAITILHEIIRKSFQFFADILRAHDISGPREYELLNTAINRKLEDPRPNEYPQVPLLIICREMLTMSSSVIIPLVVSQSRKT